MSGNIHSSDTIHILWTGGWDSSYVLVEKSRQLVTILPIYVHGDGRQSEALEIEAMDKILKALSEKKETKATILPVKFVDKKDIPENAQITNAFHTIHQKTNLGSQHEWLSRLAYQYKNLEIGTEAGATANSKILQSLDLFCKLIQSESKEYYYADPLESTKEGFLVFGNFRFSIIDKTEIDMKKNIENWGYEDVMNLIWFCHTPISKKPCGLCHPCEVKIENHMEQLLPKSAIKRYHRKNKIPFNLLYKIRRKISRL